MSYAVPSNHRPLSFRNMFTATLGAAAAFAPVSAAAVGRVSQVDSLAPRGLPRPVNAGPRLAISSATATIVINPGPSPTAASKAQISQLANVKQDPAFNVQGVSATLKTPPSFTLYPAGDPSPSDVDQTVLGDCYFDSVMGAFAQQGSKAVKAMFSGGKNDQYTVKMYDLAGNSLKVNLNDALPFNSDNTMVGTVGPSGEANWASLAEKAYAKYNDVFQVVSKTTGYAGISAGGDPGSVFRAFTGKSVVYDWHTSYVTPSQRTQFAQELQHALKNGQPVAVASNNTFTLPSGAQIIGSHAYTIMQVDQSKGDWFIDIRNPWGITGNVKGSSHTTDDGVLRMGFGDYVDMLILTYYPNASVANADDNNSFDPPDGQAPVDGGDAGMPSSAASIRPLGWAALAGVVALLAL